jgi:hypothetical protein
MNKIKVFDKGSASVERLFPSGMYLVKCYTGQELHDKVMCDTYMRAMEYFRAFCRIAKNGGAR